MFLSGVNNYHEGEQSHYEHTSGVNVNNTWFLTSDTRILRQQKRQCNARDTSIPYINLWKNFSGTAGTAGVSSTFELLSETAESMIWQSVLLELEKQKAELAMDQQKEKTNSSKVKSPVKRKSKFTNRSSKENDKKRKITLMKMKKKKMTKKERDECVIT